MKTIDAYNLFQALHRVQNEPTPRSAKFGYAVSLNIKRVQDTAVAFETARTSLIEAWTTKDGEGKPIITDGNYQITDMAAFNAEVMSLHNADVGDLALMLIDLDDIKGDIEPNVVGALVPMIKVPA